MNQKPYWAVIAAAIMAGASGVFVKYMEMPATSMSFVRMFLPTALLGATMLYKSIPFFRGNYPLMLGASVLNALRMFLFFNAFIYSTIGKVVLILFTWPIFVTIFSAIFLRESITRRTIFLLALSFSGIVLVYANEELSLQSNDFIGLSAALGTAMLYAITVVMFKKESGNYTRTEIIFYQNLVGVFVFLPFILWTRPWPSTQDIVLSSSHGLFMGIIGFHFFFYGLRHLKASVASLLAYIEIVSAMLFSTFLLKEPITTNMIAGGVLIVVSSLFVRRQKV